MSAVPLARFDGGAVEAQGRRLLATLVPARRVDPWTTPLALAKPCPAPPGADGKRCRRPQGHVGRHRWRDPDEAPAAPERSPVALALLEIVWRDVCRQMDGLLARLRKEW